MWKRIWNKAESSAGHIELHVWLHRGQPDLKAQWVPWWWRGQAVFPPSSGRRWREAPEVGFYALLTERNQWIPSGGTFSGWSWDRAMTQKTMRLLHLLSGTMQGEHLWFSPRKCFLPRPLCRAFPSTYHSFFSSLFFSWKHHTDVMQASIWCFLLFSIQEWSKMKKWLNGNWLTVWI